MKTKKTEGKCACPETLVLRPSLYSSCSELQIGGKLIHAGCLSQVPKTAGLQQTLANGKFWKESGGQEAGKEYVKPGC